MSFMNSLKLISQMKDAILSNSLNLVNQYLEQGCDPNGVFNFPNSVRDVDEFEGEEEKVLVPDSVKFSGDHSACNVSFVFQAIRNLFDNLVEPKSNLISFEILKQLLKHGANVTKRFTFLCCNPPGFYYERVLDNNAIDFAVFLKQRIQSNYNFAEHHELMEKVICCLVEAEKQAGHLRPTMHPVPVYTYKTWQKMLFNEGFSDVAFICADKPEDKICAHKAVLAAASPYFQTLFSGNWQETKSNNEIQTQNSYAVMKLVLRFIYTGEINETIVNNKAQIMLGLASEWQLTQLMVLCEQCCIRSLSQTNVKDTLLLACLHDCTSLKESCLKFIKQHSGKLLVSRKFISLREENHDVWRQVKLMLSDGNASESEQDVGEDEEEEGGGEEKDEEGSARKKQRISSEKSDFLF